MRYLFYVLSASLLLSCGSKNLQSSRQQVQATIDLVNVIDDKLIIDIISPTITTDKITFYMPEIVPGTYSDSDFGNFIQNVRAFTKNNEALPILKTGDNTWQIDNAQKLFRLSYQVNDTFDIEGTHEIFSPSGTNILVGKHFMLNLHGIIGYFEGLQEIPYQLSINRPSELEGSTSLPEVSSAKLWQEFLNTDTVDHFYASRYFQIIDNPIMYNKPNTEVFTVGDIEIELSVYSPNNIVSASDLKPNVLEMMKAQKTYLGDLNATKKYSILLYLSTSEPTDAQGFGALEHHTSTVVVLPEGIPLASLDEAMLDVVSHEFFHTLTPLTVHSKEIHNFSFNAPKMSQHLWMYEGVTEYFAQHFQVQQGLRPRADYYNVLTQKIGSSLAFDDALSFTEMSKNVLAEPFASQYVNVYQKGALIGMCLDILLLEESQGQTGILDLMKTLSRIYGIDKPFDDSTIIDEIVSLTSPTIEDFFTKHVVGNTPIPYENFFQKVGLSFESSQVPSTSYFFDQQTPFINVNQQTGDIFIMSGIDLNTFMLNLGLEGNDIIKTINNKAYTLQNVRELIGDSQNWKEGDPINFVVERKDEEVALSGKVTAPYVNRKSLVELQYLVDGPELRLRESWLKGS